MTVQVPSDLLHTIFIELASLFKFNEQYRAFNVTVKDSYLYINANTGIRYEAVIPVEATGTISANILFKDVSEVIGQRGTVKLDIHETYVILSTGIFEITFSMANEVVTPLLTGPLDGEVMVPDTYSYIVGTLTNTAQLRKAYKLDPYLIFNGKYAYIKFPTVYIRTAGSGLDMTIDSQSAYTVRAMKPTSYKYQGTDTVAFSNDHAVLIVPCSRPEDISFDKLLPSEEFVATWDMTGVANYLRKAHKVLGDGMCMLYLGDSGFVLHIMRAGVNSKMMFGDATTITKHAVQLPLEFLLNIATLLEGTTKVTMGGGKLWLQGTTTAILASVTS